jgi:EAL domain-containing protein (putative c-di-GMP-specific phosphodiesterase class I)
LNLLADLQTDLIKIDMEIIRGVTDSAARQAIIAGILVMARALDITIIAEGIETEAELATLRDAGINLFQGFFFAKPALEDLPTVSLST